jgi:hypothetical protein
MYDIIPYIPLAILVAMGLIIHTVTGDNSTTTEKKKTRGRKKKK